MLIAVTLQNSQQHMKDYHSECTSAQSTGAVTCSYIEQRCTQTTDALDVCMTNKAGIPTHSSVYVL